jgi:hypothetical protein
LPHPAYGDIAFKPFCLIYIYRKPVNDNFSYWAVNLSAVDGMASKPLLSGGGLEVACWPLVPKFAGSHPAEAVGFLGRKKFSVRLPSEWK